MSTSTIDHVMAETLPTLHLVMLKPEQTTAIRGLMNHFAGEHPARFWAAMVSTPLWREDRPEMIRTLAVADDGGHTGKRDALVMAELTVLAIEAVAALWTPEQCRTSAVRINDKVMASLVCSNEVSRGKGRECE